MIEKNAKKYFWQSVHENKPWGESSIKSYNNKFTVFVKSKSKILIMYSM